MNEIIPTGVRLCPAAPAGFATRTGHNRKQAGFKPISSGSSCGRFTTMQNDNLKNTRRASPQTMPSPQLQLILSNLSS